MAHARVHTDSASSQTQAQETSMCEVEIQQSQCSSVHTKSLHESSRVTTGTHGHIGLSTDEGYERHTQTDESPSDSPMR